jgi:hypothetical protein
MVLDMAHMTSDHASDTTGSPAPTPTAAAAAAAAAGGAPFAGSTGDLSGRGGEEAGGGAGEPQGGSLGAFVRALSLRRHAGGLVTAEYSLEPSVHGGSAAAGSGGRSGGGGGDRSSRGGARFGGSAHGGSEFFREAAAAAARGEGGAGAGVGRVERSWHAGAQYGERSVRSGREFLTTASTLSSLDEDHPPGEDTPPGEGAPQPARPAAQPAGQ